MKELNLNVIMTNGQENISESEQNSFCFYLLMRMHKLKKTKENNLCKKP